jgi:hypothetical protein
MSCSSCVLLYLKGRSERENKRKMNIGVPIGPLLIHDIILTLYYFCIMSSTHCIDERIPFVISLSLLLSLSLFYISLCCMWNTYICRGIHLEVDHSRINIVLLHLTWQMEIWRSHNKQWHRMALSRPFFRHNRHTNMRVKNENGIMSDGAVKLGKERKKSETNLLVRYDAHIWRKYRIAHFFIRVPSTR